MPVCEFMWTVHRCVCVGVSRGVCTGMFVWVCHDGVCTGVFVWVCHGVCTGAFVWVCHSGVCTGVFCGCVKLYVHRYVCVGV